MNPALFKLNRMFSEFFSANKDSIQNKKPINKKFRLLYLIIVFNFIYINIINYTPAI